MKIATCGVLLMCMAVGQAATDEDSDAELKKVEGRWERIAHNAAGTRFRILKDVAGEQDTVTTFDDLGNILTRTHQHSSSRSAARCASFRFTTSS